MRRALAIGAAALAALSCGRGSGSGWRRVRLAGMPYTYELPEGAKRVEANLPAAKISQAQVVFPDGALMIAGYKPGYERFTFFGEMEELESRVHAAPLEAFRKIESGDGLRYEGAYWFAAKEGKRAEFSYLRRDPGAWFNVVMRVEASGRIQERRAYYQRVRDSVRYEP